MRNLVLIGIASIILFINSNGCTKINGKPVPLPQIYTASENQFYLNPSEFKFQFARGSYVCDVTRLAFTRYHKLIFNPDQYEIVANRRVVKKRPLNRKLMLNQRFSYNQDSINQLLVNVAEPCEEYPTLESDESYTLEINSNIAILYAKTNWGSLRGLETFSQLIYENEGREFVVNETYIKDYPRFNHRGLLLDTSRHFLDVSLLKINLEAMEANKMNVFHWHIVDDNSFPYQSYTFPELSDKGAFDPYTHVYTYNDIKEVIEFARQRGIRVIPEFDTPGHTLSWGKAIDDILTPCYTDGVPDGTFGPLNPMNNKTYDVLKDLIKEVANVFPDKYVHLGGDEVNFTCWESNPELKSFMTNMGYNQDYDKLEQYYVQNLLDIVKETSPSTGYMIWQEVIDNNVKVKQDTIVEVWKDPWPLEMAKITQSGYRTLLSTCWYLDIISYGPDWIKYYECEPFNFEGTEEQKSLIIGGESCVWGEFIDGSNVISRSWPRSSAVAERLWSDRNVTDIKDATERLEEQRCRMIRRGINAEPLNGPGYCEYEVNV